MGRERSRPAGVMSQKALVLRKARGLSDMKTLLNSRRGSGQTRIERGRRRRRRRGRPRMTADKAEERGPWLCPRDKMHTAGIRSRKTWT